MIRNSNHKFNLGKAWLLYVSATPKLKRFPSDGISLTYLTDYLKPSL